MAIVYNIWATIETYATGTDQGFSSKPVLLFAGENRADAENTMARFAEAKEPTKESK